MSILPYVFVCYTVHMFSIRTYVRRCTGAFIVCMYMCTYVYMYVL